MAVAVATVSAMAVAATATTTATIATTTTTATIATTTTTATITTTTATATAIVRRYVMLPDSGSLTVKQAREEFHGPVTKAKAEDRKWPYTEARKKAYNRRREFIDLIKRQAYEERRSIDEVLETLTTKFKNSTILLLLKSLEPASYWTWIWICC
ncbi:hypothetical protein BGZ65_002454 [Modicella reniformis]|uniref:Uncharacterized protein n=1 Tax=Modicella reniformis TaxID=1440133 RepID=A0A9P6LST7_9FUNG|nr:hypothetical protein BGZ65_002454 [Modicella reniformis]